VWAAPSTTPTLWSLSRNWVSILKELRSLPPSSMCTPWTLLLNLTITDVPFPVLSSTLIRSWFQIEPATLLIPIDFSFPFCGGGALRYSVPKWLLFLINVRSGFHCLRSFFFSFFLVTPSPWWWKCLQFSVWQAFFSQCDKWFLLPRSFHLGGGKTYW